MIGGGALGLTTVALPTAVASASTVDSSQLLTPMGTYSAPTNLQATAGDTMVSLAWSAVSGAVSYQVQYRAGSSGPFTLGGNTDQTGLSVTGLTNGVSYEFVVVATDNVSNVSQSSNTATATPQLALPGVPTGLSASPGNADFTASWNTPETGGAVESYDLRYGTDGTNWTTVTGVSGTTETVGDLSNGQEYFVQVRAVNSSGASNWTVSDTAIPSASTSTGIANISPQPPVLSATTALTVATIFTDKGEDSWRYYYSTNGGTTYTEAPGITSSSTSFNVTGLTGSSYTLKVQKRASNGTTVEGTSTLTLARRTLNYTSGQVYTVTNGSGNTRPTQVKLTLVGGGGGGGGADASKAGGSPSQPGQVVATRTWGSGSVITLAAGSGGTAGASGATSSGGGSGGSNAFGASEYKGGPGAKAGPYGSSGGGGGGGAASVVKVDGTVAYVAGGAGGGGGAESRRAGANGDGSNSGGASGTNGGGGSEHTNSNEDAAGGGGGGGGNVGGAGGPTENIAQFDESCGWFCTRTIYVKASLPSKRGTNLAATGTVTTDGFATGRANGSSGYVTVEYLETTSLVQS